MKREKLGTSVYTVDFCVVGGGLAGLCAAVAAARKGLKVALMQERPVLGGNASSEIRMWACGSHGKDNRETGIIEEINLENLYRNGTKNYYIWDSILLETVEKEKNIELFLNCTCLDAKMKKNKIVSVTGWQLTTQRFITVNAKFFSDCSGDSILAPLTGAHYRIGREDPKEFGEITTYDSADKKTMGLSCLLQGRKTDRKIDFVAPDWATKMTPEIISKRTPHMDSVKENYWYLELGGDRDSIGDTEKIRKDLLALALGFWDYIKNSGTVPDAEYWDLEFLGFLPGKRESRRMVGAYMMNQRDVMNGGHFEDTVAYGGWPLDDHHPGGFFYPGAPNIEVSTPAPYGIPYRCLYSENVENLFFAGRNISMSHCAMSSARVMATCAILGQAVGTAVSIAVKKELTPDEVDKKEIALLQRELMEDGCFLPGMRRKISELCKSAKLSCSACAENLENLRNGADRNNHTLGQEDQGCNVPMGSKLTYTFTAPEQLQKIHIAFDSDLNRETLPGSEFERYHGMKANILPNDPVMHIPYTLPKQFTLTGIDETGKELLLYQEKENRKQTINVLPNGKFTSISLCIEELWKENTQPIPEKVHLFSFDCR